MLTVLMVLLPVGLVLGVVSQLYAKERKIEAQSSETTKPNFNGNTAKSRNICTMNFIYSHKRTYLF